MTNQATLSFIRANQDADTRQLALRGAKNPEVDLAYALDQIAGRQKARTKLPSWAATEGIVFPPHLAMEQCSSERTAAYKARVAASANKPEGEQHRQQRRLVDLTGGFGVDFSFLAPHFEQAVYVERQARLCAISSENFRLLGLNARVVNADSTQFLHTLDHASLIFIDPARRDEHGRRTYGMADCTPNVLEMMDELLAKADRLLLKLSPMLDWQKAVADIRAAGRAAVRALHIVSAENECKELLVVVTACGPEAATAAGTLPVTCVNLRADGSEEHFTFDAADRQPAARVASQEPAAWRFLFEPNASVMKAGCFGIVAERFGVAQPERNSHLFVSDREVGQFPGRSFVIEKSCSLNKREVKEALTGIGRANIAVRNFPLSVADLRKRLKLKDGGHVYVFATTTADGSHRLFICRKTSV